MTAHCRTYRLIRTAPQRRLHFGAVMLWAAVVVLSAGCAGRPPAAAPAAAQSLTLGAPTALEAALPLLVAQEQGFFEQRGLTVTLRKYDNGQAAMTALLQNELDVAGPMSEYVLAGHALAAEAAAATDAGAQAPKAQAIANLDTVEFAFLVARQDHGIRTVADLAGKRVGVVKRTSAEFYLGRFLTLHGVDPARVVQVGVDSQPAGVAALVAGTVDAFISGEPYPSQAAQQLGDRALVWPAQSSQPAYALLVGRKGWIAGHPAAVERLLAALDDANEWIAHQPAAAQRLAAARQGLTGERLAAAWQRNHYALSLDLALVIAMEDEARWMIETGLTTARAVPDLDPYVYLDALQAVKPAAVTLVR